MQLSYGVNPKMLFVLLCFAICWTINPSLWQRAKEKAAQTGGAFLQAALHENVLGNSGLCGLGKAHPLTWPASSQSLMCLSALHCLKLPPLMSIFSAPPRQQERARLGPGNVSVFQCLWVQVWKLYLYCTHTTPETVRFAVLQIGPVFTEDYDTVLFCFVFFPQSLFGTECVLISEL